MKLTLKTDDGEKEIDVKNPKGRHINKLWDFLEKMQEDEIKGTKEYIAYVDKVASEISGLSIEELNELDMDEKEKITRKITDKAFSSLDFTKPLLQQDNSMKKKEQTS